MSESETQDVIRNFIVEELSDGDIAIDTQSRLFEHGLVDSMNLVRLLAFLEQQFNTRIPVSMVNDQHFASIASISALLDSIQDHTA